MEEIDDFDLVIQSRSKISNVFWAVFDIDTGKVTGIYPGSSADDQRYKIEIDPEIVSLINKGQLHLSNCFVDVSQQSLQIVNATSLIKIDDILHRVPERKWSTDSVFDVYIKYNKQTDQLTLSLADYLGGTEQTTDKTRKNISWLDDTNINLIVSDYNDPNVIYYLLSLRLKDMIGQEKVFKNIKIQGEFSVYTRRIFKKYILEKI